VCASVQLYGVCSFFPFLGGGCILLCEYSFILQINGFSDNAYLCQLWFFQLAYIIYEGKSMYVSH
jgi:hypothetical protein